MNEAEPADTADAADGAGEDGDSSAADWGLSRTAPGRSWMESNTKFGLALIVLLVGTLGFVVYKKMEKRRAELAAAAAAEHETGSDAGETAGDEGDLAGGNGTLPPQSEPGGSDASLETRSTAYRPRPSGQREHPLAETSRRSWSDSDSRAARSADPDEPNPFDPRQSAAPVTSRHDGWRREEARAQQTPQQSGDGIVSNPFHDSPETPRWRGEGRRRSADGAERPEFADADPTGGEGLQDIASDDTRTAQSAGQPEAVVGLFDSPFADTEPQAQPQADAADAAEPAELPEGWSGGTVEIQAGATTAIEPQRLAPVSHDAPWGRHRAGSAHAGGASASQATPFSPMQRRHEHVPRTAPPTHAATPAQGSPWDAADGTGTAANGTANGVNENPFDRPPNAAASSTHPGGARPQPDFDLSRFAAAGQSFVKPGDRPAVYIVRPGDNYWEIARRQYGTSRYHRALAVYNSHRIPDPHRMRPGMKVLVPDPQILETRFASLIPRPAGATASLPPGLFQDPYGQVLYRVGRGDTLGGIAQRHLGRASRWTEIYQLNGDRLASPAALKIGMELRLPASASRVQLVSDAAERR